MNKRLPLRKPLSQSLTQLNDMDMGCNPGLLPDEGLVLESLTHKSAMVPNGILSVPPGSELTHLVSRGSAAPYDTACKLAKLGTGSLSAPESPPDS